MLDSKLQCHLVHVQGTCNYQDHGVMGCLKDCATIPWEGPEAWPEVVPVTITASINLWAGQMVHPRLVITLSHQTQCA